MALVLLPYMFVPDPTRSRAVFNGKIYIGVADEDPRIPAFQKQAFLIQESGDLVPAEYPILTNSGGIPTYNGSVVAIDVDGDYSIAIDDRNNQQVYYFPNAGESASSEFTTTDLRSLMFDLGFKVEDIGVKLIAATEGYILDGVEYILNVGTGEVWRLPSDIPTSSEIISLTGSTLVTNNGQFELIKKQDDITQEVSPLNNDWNGYLDPSHTVPIEFEDTSAGTRSFTVDAELAPNIFASDASNITFADDGWIMNGGIYKKYTFTAEQLALIDLSAIPVNIKDELGNVYHVNNSTDGVSVTSISSTEIKIEITNLLLTTIGIAKVWEFFVTETIGIIPTLGVEGFNRAIKIPPTLLAAGDFVNGNTITFDHPLDRFDEFYVEVETTGGYPTKTLTRSDFRVESAIALGSVGVFAGQSSGSSFSRVSIGSISPTDCNVSIQSSGFLSVVKTVYGVKL